jgi:hypothetical protein
MGNKDARRREVKKPKKKTPKPEPNRPGSRSSTKPAVLLSEASGARLRYGFEEK